MTDEKDVMKAQKELLYFMLESYLIEYLPLTDELQRISDKYNFDQLVLADSMLRPLRNKNLIEITSNLLGAKRNDKYQSIASYSIRGHLTDKGFQYLNAMQNIQLNNQLAQSTLDTNESIKKLSRHQKINMWVVVVVISLALIVQYKQYGREYEQDELKNTFQKDLLQTQLQMQSLKMSLDSMRGLYLLDSSAKTKKKP